MPDAQELADDYRKIVDNNWYTNFGPFEKQFRSVLEDYLSPGVKVATCANATAATMLALRACLGSAEPGENYVIVPSFTFAAGPLAIRWAGFEPVFIDIDPVTLQVRPDDARAVIEKLGRAVRGILLCNSFGIGTDVIEEWESLASERELPLVIDSAAGFGSAYVDGTLVGTRGDCEIFSFHATKTLAIGEGGAVASRNPAITEAVDRLQNFGFDAVRSIHDLGMNAKLSELSAAIGIRQVAAFDEVVAQRRHVVSTIESRLDPRLVRVVPGVGRSAVCFLSLIAASSEDRDRLRGNLVRAGVEARTYYSPVHLEPYFSKAFTWGRLENTRDVSGRILSVPAHEGMSGRDMQLVCRALSGYESPGPSYAGIQHGPPHALTKGAP